VSGTLALVGGGEFAPGCTFDTELLEAAGERQVVVLPTGAAFEHPERVVHRAEAWFGQLGASVRPLMVLRRSDAFVPEHVAVARDSAFTYVVGTSPMHLRSVLKGTPLWDALVEALDAGGVLAASGAGAMVVSDPMVDPRGGAFTLGLGLVRPLAVVPQVEQWSADRLHRTLDLAVDDRDHLVLTLESASAAICGPDDRWRTYGRVTVYRGHTPVGPEALPGRVSSR
jgi:cyanophycinase